MTILSLILCKGSHVLKQSEKVLEKTLDMRTE